MTRTWPISDDTRSLIDAWAEHGMPDNDSTRAYAVRLIVHMVTAYDALVADIDTVIGNARQMPGQLDLFEVTG